MRARLPTRSVILPQSCVGGANLPPLWRTSATLQDRCQCYSRRQDADPARPSDSAWPQPESEPEPTYGRDTKCSRGTAAEDNGG